MELEKKKVRCHRHVNSGPMIKYHSLTMPLDYLGDVTVETISDLRKLVCANEQKKDRTSKANIYSLSVK